MFYYKNKKWRKIGIMDQLKHKYLGINDNNFVRKETDNNSLCHKFIKSYTP